MATKNIEPNLRLISEYTKLGKDDRFRIRNTKEAIHGQLCTAISCGKT